MQPDTHHQPQHAPHQPAPLQPVPVVKVLSPYGVEYVFLAISLFFGASSLVALLMLLVNGVFDGAALSMPTAVLVVALPVFAVLFLRLKRLELRNPELRFDASKRRSTQAIQIIAFLACLLSLIGLVFTAFSAIGGEGSVPAWRAALNALCVILVAGGILFYYYRDEHRYRGN